MAERNQNYKEHIQKLLSNYVGGWDIFKKAADWDSPIEKKPEAEGKPGLPDSWLELADKVIGIIAHEKYGLDTYSNVIEIVDADRMLDMMVHAEPHGYDHWSFGLQRAEMEKGYQQGKSGLAYEMILNTNPAVAYCMEANTKVLQMLVVAHASYGHNDFFKNNYLFREFTRADQILGDLERHRLFIKECEERYGEKEVEQLLDACHALQLHSVSKYKIPPKRTPEQEEQRRHKIEEARQRAVDDVMDWTTGPAAKKDFDKANDDDEGAIPPDLADNLLRYMAEYAPHLQPWQREIMKCQADRIQYFYPQMQTKAINEGWASFMHYNLMYDLYDLGLIDDGMVQDFLHSHVGVLFQPDFDDPRYSGINPYWLTFNIFQDIRRMCENPTDEDREWFPAMAGNPDWIEAVKYARANFKDESFILQYLSPKVIRDKRLFAWKHEDRKNTVEVTAIHNEAGYRKVRETLSASYDMGLKFPQIDIVKYDYRGKRSLTLRHKIYNDQPLDEKHANEVLKHMYRYWQHPVIIESVNEEGKAVSKLGCPALPPEKIDKKNLPVIRR
jgi:stage V sporulation protein R